jgi:hypothetical protein
MKGGNITERAGYAQPLQWPGYDQISKGVMALEHCDPSGEPDPESESMLPVELQKKATKRAGRSPLKGP